MEKSASDSISRKKAKHEDVLDSAKTSNLEKMIMNQGEKLPDLQSLNLSEIKTIEFSYSTFDAKSISILNKIIAASPLLETLHFKLSYQGFLLVNLLPAKNLKTLIIEKDEQCNTNLIPKAKPVVLQSVENLTLDDPADTYYDFFSFLPKLKSLTLKKEWSCEQHEVVEVLKKLHMKLDYFEVEDFMNWNDVESFPAKTVVIGGLNPDQVGDRLETSLQDAETLIIKEYDSNVDYDIYNVEEDDGCSSDPKKCSDLLFIFCKQLKTCRINGTEYTRPNK